MKPEMAVRKLVHSLGYRYRLHRNDLPGRPDLVLPSRGKLIFVHGCFWHQHDCPRGARFPKSHRNYWIPKLQGNKQRDAMHQDRLRKRGWELLVIWECETGNCNAFSERIKAFLETQKTV